MAISPDKDEPFPNLLRTSREGAGLTYAEVAAAIGVPVAELEFTGSRRPASPPPSCAQLPSGDDPDGGDGKRCAGRADLSALIPETSI